MRKVSLFISATACSKAILAGLLVLMTSLSVSARSLADKEIELVYFTEGVDDRCAQARSERVLAALDDVLLMPFRGGFDSNHPVVRKILEQAFLRADLPDGRLLFQAPTPAGFFLIVERGHFRYVATRFPDLAFQECLRT